MKDIFVDFDVKLGVSKLWKWKFWIIGACVVGGLLAIFLSFRIPNEFKAQAAFIPPDISSLNSMVFTSGLGYRGFEAAMEEDIDRTVDYLSSIQVTDSISEMYKLWDHYGVNPESENSEKLFYYIYSTKNKINFSDRSTVVIECWDVSADTASMIANTYLEIAEELFETISQRKRGFEVVKQQLKELRAQQKEIEDSLSYLRKTYNIYHLDHVGNNVDNILAAQIRNNPKFSEYYDRLVALEFRQNYTEERISDLHREYDARKQNLEQYPSLMMVTQRGKPVNFKDRPKRSIIVALATFGVFCLSCFVVLLVDKGKPEDNVA